MTRCKLAGLLMLLLLLLCACGSQASDTLQQNKDAAGEKQPDVSTVQGGSYEAPPFADSAFHADAAQGDSGVQLDLSAAADGYIAIAATADSRLKFQVIQGENTYTYDISNDGTPAIFPLQCGNGSYQYRVMKNIVDTKYAVLYSAESEVTLTDEFQPFLRPSQYVNYTQTSACVQKASELAAAASSEVDVVSKVYDYICKTVTYDEAKASSVQSGYVPDVDETLRTGKGICFDYASLAAAMLRSQGIPTKEIFGYVSPNDLYHAWNMFYTEETGWVTVDYQVTQDSWSRLDLTFSANGSDSTFVGDGQNYTDVYIY